MFGERGGQRTQSWLNFQWRWRAVEVISPRGEVDGRVGEREMMRGNSQKVWLTSIALARGVFGAHRSLEMGGEGESEVWVDRRGYKT